MIEDKDLGLKVAENEDEALWTQILKEADVLIKQSEQNIKVQKALQEIAKTRLEECQKK